MMKKNAAFGPTGPGQNSFSHRRRNPSTSALNKALLSILNPKAKGISPGCRPSLRPMSMPTGHTPSEKRSKLLSLSGSASSRQWVTLSTINWRSGAGRLIQDKFQFAHLPIIFHPGATSARLKTASILVFLSRTLALSFGNPLSLAILMR